MFSQAELTTPTAAAAAAVARADTLFARWGLFFPGVALDYGRHTFVDFPPPPCCCPDVTTAIVLVRPIRSATRCGWLEWASVSITAAATARAAPTECALARCVGVGVCGRGVFNTISMHCHCVCRRVCVSSCVRNIVRAQHRACAMLHMLVHPRVRCRCKVLWCSVCAQRPTSVQRCMGCSDRRTPARCVIETETVHVCVHGCVCIRV